MRIYVHGTALTMKIFFENAQKSPLLNFWNPTQFAEHGKQPRFSKYNANNLFLTMMSYIFIYVDHY